MEVRQLHIFRVLAEELNFTRTAERVHTVQSNVTTQIKSLEQELGTPLFDRLAKRVVLTEAGRSFLPYAEKALAAMDEGERAVRYGHEAAGPLRIGAPESVLTYRLPRILGRFRQRHPHVNLIFRPHWDESLTTTLESGQLDMAIRMVDVIEADSLHSVRLRTERVFYVAHPAHPLSGLAQVHPRHLAGQVLLLTEAGCAYRKKLDQVLAAQDIRPENIVEFTSVEAIKQCVIAGMGLGLLPEIVVRGELDSGQMKALSWAGPSVDIATHVIWHKDKWMSPSMTAFLNLLQEDLKEDETTAPMRATATC